MPLMKEGDMNKQTMNLRTTRLFGVAAFLCALACCNVDIAADKAAISQDANVNPPKVTIVLVGDSTVTDASGWGLGFAKLLGPEAKCINWAKSGRSSRSYRDEGWWEKALAEKPDYLLIQFGHNDQPGKGPQRETDPKTTFPERIARYVDEARAAGITPILITSLTRRHFDADGKIKSNLQPYADAVKQVAGEKRVPVIDLHAHSVALHNELGPKKSELFDPVSEKDKVSKDDKPKGPDRTHLSPEGAEIIGQIVAEELKKVVPERAGCFQ